MAVDEMWIQAIHSALISALGIAIAEAAKDREADPIESVRKTRVAIEKQLATFTMTARTASGATIDAAPELRRRMAKLLDDAEERAVHALGLPSAGRQVQ